MISLNYTGSANQDQPQLEPLFSTGGFVSSSQVANDFFSNLFGEITLSTIANRSVNYISLGMRTDEAIENLGITIKTTKANQGRFRIAAALISKDDCEKFNIPKIQNTNSKPVNLSFFDCTSFFGETKLGFTTVPFEGDTIQIWDGLNQIGEIIYDLTFEEVYIFPNFQDDFALERRINNTTEQLELFLIQKKLLNFNGSIELINEASNLSIEDNENFLPELNLVNMGSLGINNLLALYLERSVNQSTIKLNSKLNCKRFFLENSLDFKSETTEKTELEITYDNT